MNGFNLKGKVLDVEVLEDGKVTKVDVEVDSNNRTEVIPVMAFNKLSVIVSKYIKVGSFVDVVGALRWNYRIKAVEPVVFKITEVDKQERKNKADVIIKKVDITPKKEQKEVVKVAQGPIKKLDRFEGMIVNIYDNVSMAAQSVGVKKSDLKRAIENGTVLGGYKWSR